jgi:hypothetical protein
MLKIEPKIIGHWILWDYVIPICIIYQLLQSSFERIMSGLHRPSPVGIYGMGIIRNSGGRY